MQDKVEAEEELKKKSIFNIRYASYSDRIRSRRVTPTIVSRVIKSIRVKRGRALKLVKLSEQTGSVLISSSKNLFRFRLRFI